MLVITGVSSATVPPYTQCDTQHQPSPAPAAPIITIHLTLDSGPGQALHQAGSQAVTGSAAKVLARADQ